MTQGAVCPQGKQAACTITAGRHSGLAAPVSRLPPCCEDHPCGTCCSRAAACAAQHDVLHAFLLDSLSHGGQNSGIHHCNCFLLFTCCLLLLTASREHHSTQQHIHSHHIQGKCNWSAQSCCLCLQVPDNQTMALTHVQLSHRSAQMVLLQEHICDTVTSADMLLFSHGTVKPLVCQPQITFLMPGQQY